MDEVKCIAGLLSNDLNLILLTRYRGEKEPHRHSPAIVLGAAAGLGGDLVADFVRLGLAGRRGVDDPQRRAGEGRAGRRMPRAAQRVVRIGVVHTPAGGIREKAIQQCFPYMKVAHTQKR